MGQVESVVCLAQDSPLALAARLGQDGCSSLAGDRRVDLGQFLTPMAVASGLASLFESADGEVRLLDPGAGVGTLTAAFVTDVLGRRCKPVRLHLTVWEAEVGFIRKLKRVLGGCVELGQAAGVPTSYTLNHGNFLRDAAELLEAGDLFGALRREEAFSHVIMNPPYRKIAADSESRLLLRRAGLETSNLYTGFLWLAARLLKQGGQMVAITPRSFCNGPYFRPFHEQFFHLMALRHLHVVDRRNAVFAGDDVLQENVVMHARRSSGERTSVTLSSSEDLPGQSTRLRTVPYSTVIGPTDPNFVVHLALEVGDDQVREAVEGLPQTLEGLGIEVSTGRVVDFRARTFLRQDPELGTMPLIYPTHFNGGVVHWPRLASRKPNALALTPDTEDLLVPAGVYVLVKRFTSKEERKRVVATVFRPEGALAAYRSVGFENHLNYFHQRGQGLNSAIAHGLAIYLNSTTVDRYFRQFSGHTQINAADLRCLRYPSREQLVHLAQQVASGGGQEAIDAAVVGVTRTSRP
jgi:adenine-specific DNA-methyltransferase